jgi:hypothetical protein
VKKFHVSILGYLTLHSTGLIIVSDCMWRYSNESEGSGCSQPQHFWKLCQVLSHRKQHLCFRGLGTHTGFEKVLQVMAN